MLENPKFSIVIPTYNREKQIARAIRSVLGQSYGDLEIIVVDDGSSDHSSEIIIEFAKKDRRVRPYFHERNCGVCPTRNTGIKNARGDWIIFIDSDHELLPGSLNEIALLVNKVSIDIARLNFIYLWDNGTYSPFPLPDGGIWDYEAYLRFWNSSLERSDMLTCTRSITFQEIKFPESFLLESIYHLDFARLFKQQFFPISLAIEHTDADNRITTMDHKKVLFYAPYRIQEISLVLERHGEALRKNAPRIHESFFRTLVLLSLMSNYKKSKEFYHEYRHYYSNFRVLLSFLLKNIFGNKILNKIYFLWKILRSRFFY